MTDGPQSTGGGEDFDDLGAAPTLPASEPSARRTSAASPGRPRLSSLRRPSRKMVLVLAVIVALALVRSWLDR